MIEAGHGEVAVIKGGVCEAHRLPAQQVEELKEGEDGKLVIVYTNSELIKPVPLVGRDLPKPLQ